MSDNDWTAQFPLQNFPDGKYVHLYIEKRTMILTNRAIAERAGYKVTTIGALPPHRRAEIRYTYNWQEVFDAPGAVVFVPNYLRSVDAALTLPLAEMCTFELRVDWKGGATARIFRLDANHQMDWHWGDTPAGAICAAWWAWRDAMEAR